MDIIDQHSNKDIQKLADTLGLIYARESMCGFIAMAVVVTVAVSSSTLMTDDGIDRSSIQQVLQMKILPWITQRRQEYIDHHDNEFLPHGTPYQDSQGRMSVEVYKGMMCSTVEIAQYLTDEKPGCCCGRVGVGVALLRNILEGPPIDETSIRFPSRQQQPGSSSFIYSRRRTFDYLEQVKNHFG